MKNLFLLMLVINCRSTFAQTLFNTPFVPCVGDTVKFYFEFDTTKIASIDSMRWQFHLNGWNINIDEVDTVVSIPFYYIFTDSFFHKDNTGFPPWPYVDLTLYVTDPDGSHGTLPGWANFGGVPDCEIRYANFKSDRRKICTGECVNFTDASDRYPRHHKWYFEGASPSYSEERNPRNICYPSPGKFAVKHIVSNSVNSDSIIVADYIEVLAQPEIITDTIIQIEGFWGDTVSLIACSEAYNYQWIPTIQISCADCPNPSLILGNQTEYILKAWNDTACIQSCKYKLKINKKDSKIYVPNVFSPNGDGNNDEFEVFGVFTELKSIEIYNRWGGLLFQNNSPSAKWDGTYKDKIVLPGVYVYRIIYTDTNLMEEKIQTGTITIVK